MATQHKATSPPPPYRDEPKDASYRTALDDLRLQDEIHGHPFTGSQAALKLRSFLGYILLIDYGIDPDGDADAAIWDVDYPVLIHYLYIARHMRDASKSATHNPELPSPQIKADVHDPARELGVPIAVAEAMIVRYSFNLGFASNYLGCLTYLEQRRGLSALWHKIELDITVVIHAVVGPQGHPICEMLKVAALEKMRYYVDPDREGSWYAPDGVGPSAEAFRSVRYLTHTLEMEEEAARSSRQAEEPVTSKTDGQSVQKSAEHRTGWLGKCFRGFK